MIEILSGTALSLNGSAMQNTFIGMFVFENGKLLQTFLSLSSNFPAHYFSRSPLAHFVFIQPTFLTLSVFAISLKEEIDCLLAPVINFCQHTVFLSGSAIARRTLGIQKMK